MHVDDGPFLSDSEEEPCQLSKVRRSHAGWDENHVVPLAIDHTVTDQRFDALPPVFGVDTVRWIFEGNDVVEDSYGPFVFNELSESRENSVAQSSPAKGKEDLNIDEVVARNRFSEIDHIEIAKDFPSFGVDLEGVKWLVAFLGLDRSILVPWAVLSISLLSTSKIASGDVVIRSLS